MRPAIQFILAIVAIILSVSVSIKAFRDVQSQVVFRYWNKMTWSFIVLFFQIIGPIFYYMVGRYRE